MIHNIFKNILNNYNDRNFIYIFCRNMKPNTILQGTTSTIFLFDVK